MRRLLLAWSALAMLLMLGTAQAQRPRGPDAWELLGEKSVGLGVDRDSIVISHGEEWYRNRAFRTLRFVAEGNDVHLISIRIVYLNGHAEDVRVDRVIRRNGELLVDLRGERSFLRQVDMRYRSNVGLSVGGGGIRLQQAMVRVYGERATRRDDFPPGLVGHPRDRGRGLMPLGDKVVGFGVDRDFIQVSHPEEWYRNRSFSALHFVAERNDIHMISLRVVYLNGFAEDLRVDRLIRQNSDFVVRLRGDRSYISRIEMVYRSRPNFGGQAVIRVYGEQARGRRDG
jgi:hypothetical protein